MYVCVCMYVYMYVCTYVHMDARTYVCIYVCKCVHVCMYECVGACMHLFSKCIMYPTIAVAILNLNFGIWIKVTGCYERKPEYPVKTTT